MKKWLLLPLLICCFLCVGWLQVVPVNEPVISGSSSCDDCSGSLVASFHFEDITGNDLTEGSPCGCTDDSTTTYSLTGGSSYSSTYASDGTYSVDVRGEDDKVDWEPSSVDVRNVGTMCMDCYFTGTADGRAFTIGTIVGTVIYNSGSPYIRIAYSSSYKNSSSTFSPSAWTRICFSWDTTQTGSTDRLAVKVGNNSWESRADLDLTPDASNPSPYRIVGGEWQYGRGYYDNVKLYNTYQAE